ncbi:TonB-dependent receptor [Hirschia litorea]|uniref:TonB-dependent receptor n=1 Tax=Hirschia litorea TaxID=1199156 RepID=A0ABW2IPK7_9PROT
MLKVNFENKSRISTRAAKALFWSASVAALGFGQVAWAQESEVAEEKVEDAKVLDTITVTGIRNSLASAQDIKRNSDTFVDAVTSEDIGALPDRSVTEALSRVPGVAISRFAAADDPDHFSIEGSGVVVRGLTFVRSEINGRDAFTANNGRALSFSDISPELLGSVQVFKNQSADLIEGGIAGSVNLVTRKPFDKTGQVIAGSIEGAYTDFREAASPTASLLYSNNWDTEIGRVGFLVSGVHSQLKTRSDGSQISSFQPRDDLADGRVWAPEGAVLRTQNYDRDRTGYSASAQWESKDEKILATVEYLRSEASTSWDEYVSEIATDNVGDTAFFLVPGTEFGFGGDDLFTHGTISAPTGWRDDQFSDPRTPIYGLQSNNIHRGNETETMTADSSFNIKWTPTERLSLNFDYQHVESTTDVVDHTIWASSFQDVSIDLRRDIPEIKFLAPTNAGDLIDCSGGISNNCPDYFNAPNDSFGAPSNSFWRAAMDHMQQSEGKQDAFRADVEYDLEDDFDWIRSVRFGARYSDREQTTRFSAFNWGALSEIWGNGGPVWFDETGQEDNGYFANYNWDNFQRSDVTTPDPRQFFQLNPAVNYGEASDFADSVVAAWLGEGAVAGGGGNGWRRLEDRPGVIAGTPFLPGEITDSTEQNTSFYAMINFGHDAPFGNGMTVEGNVGLRYVKTDVSTTGGAAFMPATTLPDDGSLGTSTNLSGSDCIPDRAEQEVSFFCELSPTERQAAYDFLDGASIDYVGDHDYEEILPSFNLKLGLTDTQIVRFAYSKALSRPDIGFLRGTFSVGAETQDDPRNPGVGVPDGYSNGFFGFTTSGGNPFLNPITSAQYDLSYEWYFDDVGSITATAFYKEIDDIIVAGSGDITLENNGQTFDVFVTNQPTNSDETAEVKGFELAYNQFFDDLPSPFDGIGVQATYTYIESTGVNPSVLNNTLGDPASNQATVDLGELPLQGLSKNNANLALIYEKDKISTRLAYSWRDEYLVTARDVITPFYPIFQEASGQLDGSFYYTLNENVKIGVQAANLLNEITVTESYLPNSDGRRGGRSWFQNDRRFTASARFNF